MIYNKKYVVGPGRNIMDAYVVVENNSVKNTKNSQSSNNLNWWNFMPKDKYNQNIKYLESSKYLIINGKKILPNWVTSLWVKWIMVSTPYFDKLPVFKKLDKLILKELSKSKYTQDDILNFFNYYNKFKFAVYYMKTKDRTVGKQYAKKYLKKMLAILWK